MSSDTPDYDAMVSEYGDPEPVVTVLDDELDKPPPRIDEAHPESDEPGGPEPTPDTEPDESEKAPDAK